MNEKILANRYRLTEQIGMGGMAIVYRAIDLRTGHNVAVKVLRPEYNEDREFISRFQREAEAASKMTHHNIVNLLDVGMDGENRYLVMEYVQGKTLKAVIQERGRLNAPLACQITIRILSALEHAHRNGIIHRDIKPQNILVHEDGHIKVADFGIARIADSATLTRGDNVMGSVHYFSPEQARGEGATAASDIYSTGIVLYEMLTGRVPFDGDNPVAVAMQHLHATPVPIQTLAPDVSPAIVHVCMKAMEKNPAMRYQSARDMAADLRAALEERGDRMIFPENELEIRQPKPQVTGGKNGSRKGKLAGKLTPMQMRTIRIVMDALIVLAVLTGLFFGGRAIIFQTIHTVKVPDVTGKDMNEAITILDKAGLKWESKTMPSDLYERGQVYMQSPDEGMTVGTGDLVVLMVSSGPVPFELPDFTGKTAEDATAFLNSRGVTAVTREKAASIEVPKGSVVSQTPAGGEMITREDAVVLVVSGGMAVVPNLNGKTMEEAEELLANVNLQIQPGLKYQLIEEKEQKHGTIASVSPETESRVAEDTPVTLTVYRDPEKLFSFPVRVIVKKDDEKDQKVRICVKASNSNVEIESRVYTVEAGKTGIIEDTFEIPDDRIYTYTAYSGETQIEQKFLNAANEPEGE